MSQFHQSSNAGDNLSIAADIRRAHTLPADFYRRDDYWALARERIFARSWHYVADAAELPQSGWAYPLNLLPGVLTEPLVLTRSTDDRWHCLSNVCTHRGNILIERPGAQRRLVCGYHGRCFDLDGRFRSMPAFEAAEDFPGPEDHLPRLPLRKWLGLLFTSLDARVNWEEMIAPLWERIGWQTLDTLEYDAASSRDYIVPAHWALYVDNYLEGLHIPFVHPALNKALDFKAYEYELYPHANLQVGVAAEGQPAFHLPDDHPDAGRSIYAYYYWVFPNLMFNFYPWGLSLNIIEPQAPDRTLIRFRTYRLADNSFDWTLNAIDQTEMEDEAVVESVQRGIQSRLYQRGRFSPSMEPGVHHFHRLVAEWMVR